MTRPSTPEPTDLLIRPATADDAGATYDVLVEASRHLARSRGWTPTAWPASPSERFLAFRASVLRHDPDGFWVAEAGGRLVAFGIAVQREHVWYLAALHVRPAWQSRGVGAEIVRRALVAARGDSLLTVGADARNPVSQALYGRFGMFPETPLLEMSGPAAPGGRGMLLPGAPPPDELAAIDRAVLGMARPQDHEFWQGVSTLHAFSVVRGGRTVGYAYVEAAGAIGPVAVRDAADLAPAVEAAVSEAAYRGATTGRIRIPGVAPPAVRALRARGWRYGDGVTLVLTSAEWGSWDRYVTSGADALL